MQEKVALQSIRAPVAVTGATGFIGRRLVDRLRAGGIETRALLLEGEAILILESYLCVCFGVSV